MDQQLSASTLTFTKSFNQQDSKVLTTEAIAFLSDLAEKFSAKRDVLLKERQVRQQKIDSGMLPDFISESDSIKRLIGKFKISLRICVIAELRSLAL